MICFNAWIQPANSLKEDAARIASGFGISMRSTTAYDEYPAYEFELTEEGEFTVSLLGPPSNVEELIATKPWEFGGKDRNYWLTVCTHTGLPSPDQVRNAFPGANPFDFGRHIVERLKSIGFCLFTDEPPYTTTNGGKLIHSDLVG